MLRIYRRPWPKLVPLLYRHSRAPPHILRRILTTSTATTTPVDIPKLPKGPGSKFHNSMPTFLDYAERTGLKPHTTVYIGTHFEYVVADALTRLGFSLIRTGKRLDDGIDLMGHWVLPPFREPIPVFLQCKARATQIPPAVARELEGSFQGLPPEWWNKDVLGLIVSDRTATRGLLETLGQSTYPMGFLKVTRDKGAIEQFLWNRAAADKGLQGLGVTLRHKPLMLEPKVKYQGGDWNWEEMRGSLHKRGLNKSIYTSLIQKDITLTWMGTPIFSNREYIGKTKEEIYEVATAGLEGEELRALLEKENLAVPPRPRRLKLTVRRPVGRPRKQPIEPDVVKASCAQSQRNDSDIPAVETPNNTKRAIRRRRKTKTETPIIKRARAQPDNSTIETPQIKYTSTVHKKASHALSTPKRIETPQVNQTQSRRRAIIETAKDAIESPAVKPTKGRPKKNAIETRPAVKQPRGRPRKVVQEAKRPRGRPRKIVQEEKLPRGRPRKIVQEEKRPREIVQEEKGPRGRPRKVIQEVKRPRGRPRKNIVATAPKQRRRSAVSQAEVNVPTELG